MVGNLNPAVNCWAMGICLSSCGLKRTMGFYYNDHISLLQRSQPPCYNVLFIPTNKLLGYGHSPFVLRA